MSNPDRMAKEARKTRINRKKTFAGRRLHPATKVICRPAYLNSWGRGEERTRPRCSTQLPVMVMVRDYGTSQVLSGTASKVSAKKSYPIHTEAHQASSDEFSNPPKKFPRGAMDVIESRRGGVASPSTAISVPSHPGVETFRRCTLSN
ncbi:hypothetical protein VFPFJ_07789 [Purpureocillium lilacinum]|uniref:Uncharacterized protein n=1 Tax=Purpureocillium lilacinum TaxID=33203 RepID=A0A179H730_PURLI|nr:hypothetical protein VFPFJ_07789 [Purpureocillium lilacinum]OAQ85400.1 hypothetical protein VFPFJ_07789 [Purpureocillium lilacinum]